MGLIRGRVPNWLKGSGSGSGSGSGYGDGSGSGYGDGYGDGSGSGSGYGDGSGSGSGYGSGCQDYQRALFLSHHKLKAKGAAVELFKIVKDDFTDAKTGTVKYQGIVELTEEQWDDSDRECGGGLHLSARIEDARAFFKQGGRILRCRVRLEDFLVYEAKYDKVRCRRVEVIEEVKE